MGFAKEGFMWVIPIVAITILSFYLNTLSGVGYWLILFIINIPLIGVSVFVAAFFRDPQRSPQPKDQYHPESSVLSPADGCICAFEEENGNFAVYVEMHASEVHVTRAPIDGIVTKVVRTSGKHYPIYVFKKTEGTETQAIRKNARVTIELKDAQNRPFLYQLVCGVIARRAKPYVKEGDVVKQGQKMGIIAFGSLTKITLPGVNYRMLVKVHEKVYAGQTIICERILQAGICMDEEENAYKPKEELQEVLTVWIESMTEVYNNILHDWQENQVIHPFPNAKSKYHCNNCGKCCKFDDYWVWVYPTDLNLWLQSLKKEKYIPILLGILFPTEDMDGILGYALPSQKIIGEKFEEMIKSKEASGIIKRTLTTILNYLKKMNPSFNPQSEYCIFYNANSEQHCSIYPYRPIQCNCYPYDYPQFTKIVIPKDLEEKYGSYPDDINDLPECTSTAYQGDPKLGIITSEEERSIVSREKANYLTSQITQDLQDEDISDVLLELYHEDILNIDREVLFVEKKTHEGKQSENVKFIAGKRPQPDHKPPYPKKKPHPDQSHNQQSNHHNHPTNTKKSGKS